MTLPAGTAASGTPLVLEDVYPQNGDPLVSNGTDGNGTNGALHYGTDDGVIPEALTPSPPPLPADDPED